MSQVPTPKDAIDTALARLHARKDAWARTGIDERIRILEGIGARLQQHAAALTEATRQVRKVAAGTPDVGEDWFYGPMVFARCVRLLIKALRAGGQPAPKRLVQRPDGQWVAHLMPSDMWDSLLYRGFALEQWIEPGKPPSQGRIYREPSEHGKLCLILGAGNLIGIPATDVLYKLFVENEVSIIKLNPVNEDGGPALETIFKPLIDDGLIAFAYGGADVGQHLTDHSLVDTIHITGSNLTHDAILWGRDAAEQARNKAAGTPRLKKEISSELGCVTPWVVVPGTWTEAELQYQARSLAGAVQQNVSFNCVAPKVLVLHKQWPQRQQFLDALEKEFAQIPSRTAYYPGAEKRYQAFLDAYPKARVLSAKQAGAVPWTLFPDVPAMKGEHALTAEAFCGLLAETSLDAGTVDEFLATAVRFCNDDVWGNLSCIVIVDDRTAQAHAPALDRAIAELRYGNIGVNAWTGACYAMMLNSFGAFPGNSLEDIQSGRGVVHNCMLFDHPQKGVLRMPFVMVPPAPWIARNRGFADLAERLTRFEGGPSLLKVPGIARAAFTV